MSRDELSVLVDGCLLPAFNGVDAPGWLLDQLAEGLGGVTLFARNVADREQLARLTAQLRGANAGAVIAIDEEGGDVTRLEALTGSSYPGNLALGAVDDVDVTRRVAASIGADLVAMGVNLNMGPVADVNSNPDNPVIGVRSFGADASLVSRHTAAYVEGLQSARVVACTKHFPGHGDTAVDSHHGLPTVRDDAAALSLALEPFRAAIAAGTQAIMTAHIVVPRYGDAPATVNARVLTELLREELGFDGVVVTDALDMGAIRRTIGDVEGAVRALAAGADALCLSGREERDVLDAIRAGLAVAVRERRLSGDRLAEAANRVRRAVSWTKQRAERVAHDDAVGFDAARRAIRCTGSARISGDPVVVQLEPVANMAAGPVPWGVTEPLRGFGTDPVLIQVSEDSKATDVPLASYAHRPVVVTVRDAHRHAWQRDVLSRVLATRPDTVVVEMGVPGRPIVEARGYVVTHGAGRVNSAAAAEVLLGRFATAETAVA